MGVSIAWVAVQDLTRDEFLRRLSLSPTGKTCAYPFKGVGFHALSEGWLLVLASRCNHRIIAAKWMTIVSAGCRAVACAVEEHVNFMCTDYWENGARLWHVQHQGDIDNESMATDGALPQRFRELMSTVQPPDSDDLDGHFHMDIPLLLAQEITGYRHDYDNPDIERSPFDALADVGSGKPWWKPW